MRNKILALLVLGFTSTASYGDFLYGELVDLECDINVISNDEENGQTFTLEVAIDMKNGTGEVTRGDVTEDTPDGYRSTLYWRSNNTMDLVPSHLILESTRQDYAGCKQGRADTRINRESLAFMKAHKCQHELGGSFPPGPRPGFPLWLGTCRLIEKQRAF